MMQCLTLAGSSHYLAMQGKPRDTLRLFLSHSGDVEHIKQKMRNFHFRVSNALNLHHTFKNEIAHRKEALYRQLCAVKRVVMQELFKAGNQKPKAKEKPSKA